jgi:predicted CopG family antitoxin
MAVKTITIDMEAYEILSRYKQDGMSFSMVIKEQLGRKRTGRDLRRILESLEMSDATVDSIDAQVKARRRSRARAPKL